MYSFLPFYILQRKGCIWYILLAWFIFLSFNSNMFWHRLDDLCHSCYLCMVCCICWWRGSGYLSSHAPHLVCNITSVSLAELESGCSCLVVFFIILFFFPIFFKEMFLFLSNSSFLFPTHHWFQFDILLNRKYQGGTPFILVWQGYRSVILTFTSKYKHLQSLVSLP